MAREFLTPTHCGLTIIKVNNDTARTIHHYTNEVDSKNYTDWYPASSIKFVPAILAGKRLSEAGFDTAENIKITFHYHSGRKPITTTWSELIDQALRPSENIQYNELVILAGHLLMNTFLIKNNYDIAMNRPYVKGKWKSRTGLQSAETADADMRFKGPKITVEDIPNGRKVDFDSARPGSYRLDVKRSASASTLSLATFLCDFVFDKDKFNIQDSIYNSIKNKMAEAKPNSDVTKQDVFTNEIIAQLNSGDWNVYHKPGYLSNETEGGIKWHYWVDVVVLESKTSPVGASYAMAIYGKEKVKTFIDKGINNKIKHQSMLNSKVFDATHLGFAEAIGILIKEGEL